MGRFGCDPGIESSRVVGSACSCLAGEDSDGSGDARVASAVRNKPPILVGMSEKVVNNLCTADCTLAGLAVFEVGRLGAAGRLATRLSRLKPISKFLRRSDRVTATHTSHSRCDRGDLSLGHGRRTRGANSQIKPRPGTALRMIQRNSSGGCPHG
jgi:hypothetical protein